MRGNITIVVRNLVIAVAFKNCSLFTKCITQIDETTTDDTENLDLVMQMYNSIDVLQIILKQQEVFGFFLKMKQLILMQILLITDILRLFCIMLNY